MSENLNFVSPKLIKECDNTELEANGERISDFKIEGLYKIILELAEYVYDINVKNLDYEQRLEKVYEKFNEEIHSQICKYSKDKFFINRNKKKKILNDCFLDGLFLHDDKSIQAKKLVKNLNNSFFEMAKRGSYNDKEEASVYFSRKDMEQFLDAYVDLCRFVLDPDCVNQEELRSLEIIEYLLNIDLDVKNGYSGLYSPFIVHALMRILSYIAALPDELGEKDLKFKELDTRKHITATLAIRSLSRFTIINKKSYIVEYSRLADKIICKEVNKISSIDNIKPIRLFEKIVSHINSCFKENADSPVQSFNIAIYGFCANKSNENESSENESNLDLSEVDDLIYEIFSWFEDLKENNSNYSTKQIKNLNITYYNTDKKSDKPGKPKVENYLYKYTTEKTKKTYTCNFKISVEPYKNFNNAHLQKTLENNSLIFLLDCPWLTTEKFSLINEGSLRTYQKWINNVSYKDDIQKKPSTAVESREFFSKTNVFTSLNDQLNRLAVSPMANYGKVARVFKDYVLNWIQDCVNEYAENNYFNKDNKKTVYIYNSSLRGLSYSEYANYPIIREESYSGKRFTIMRLSAAKKDQLVMKNPSKPQEIYIPLWNLLKYVNINFAYTDIKDFLIKHYRENIVDVNGDREGKKLSPEEGEELIKRDLISICRNIIFKISYNAKTDCYIRRGDIPLNIKIELVLESPVRKRLENDANIAPLKNFFKEIIQSVIFCNTKRLGDHYIREAFERCLYNRAQSVNDMFFFHIYSKSRELGQLNSNNVEIADKECSVSGPSKVPKFSMFKDKKAYQKLFDLIDIPQCSEFAVYSVLNETDKIFTAEKKNEKHSNTIIKNILSLCEEYNYRNSFLYENSDKFRNQ